MSLTLYVRGDFMELKDMSEYNQHLTQIMSDSRGFVIFKRCPEGVCFAADTFEKGVDTNKNIHRLTYDKEKKVVFAFSGYTTREMEEGSISVGLLAKDLFPLVGEYKDIEIAQWIKINLFNFLKDPKALAERNIQYMYYHMGEAMDLESALILYPATAISCIYEPFIYKDSFTIGVNSNSYNEKHIREDNEKKSLEEIKKECIKEVNARINDMRIPAVGGKAEWITIDKNGNVETNIED